MRLPILALVACLVASAPLGAAESATNATPDALAADAASLRVHVKGNANVRYGPNREAKVAVMLKDGDEVEILGESRVRDWFVVRFPGKARAWVHRKVVDSVDTGKRWRVNTAGGRARDDATLRSEIVAELQLGEVLDDRSDVRGDWIAVHLPNAVAYMHRSVLMMPDDVASARRDSAGRATRAVAVWAAAQKTYGEFRDAVQGNPEAANYLDWDGLGTMLDEVIHDHGETAVRTAAKRLKDGIINVSSAAAAYQKAKGIAPVKKPLDAAALIAAQPVAAAIAPEVKPGADRSPSTAPTTVIAKPISGGPAIEDPLVPKRLFVPGGAAEVVQAQPLPALIPAEAAPKPLVQPSTWTSEGMLVQQAHPRVGVSYVLVDSDNNVLAFLLAKPGAEVPFSEYFWRLVGVRGATTMTEAASNGLGRPVPLVTVAELGLMAR